MGQGEDSHHTRGVVRSGRRFSPYKRGSGVREETLTILEG